MSLLINGRRDHVRLMKHIILGADRIKRADAFELSIIDYDDNDKLSLSTKYYDAQIALHEAHLDSEAPSSAQWEGYILVISDPLDTIVNMRNFLALQAEDKDVETRIAVVLRNDNGLSTSLISREECLDWTLDHGFELIEIDVLTLNEGWNDREKESLPRLIEALSSSRWSSATKKKSIPIAEDSEPKAESGQEEERKPLSNQQASGENRDEGDQLEGFDFEDANILNDFSAIFDEVRRVRDASLSNSLSDEERRRRAEQVAMKLSQMLNDFDDEDE